MTHPDLFALLRGELTNAEASAAGEHLALQEGELTNAEASAAGEHLVGCTGCREELAELAVGNAMLSRAVRTTAGPGGTADPPPVVPPLRPVTGRHAHPRAMTLLAAAVAVVAGVGLGAAGLSFLDGSSDGEAPRPAYASIQLDTVEGAGADAAGGEVRMVEERGQQTRMTIDARDLPGAGDGHFYYAWLLDPDTNKMLPLGQIGPSGTAAFDLDDELLGAYSAIDVSLEDDDGDPGHSVTSVLRGSYSDTRASAS